MKKRNKRIAALIMTSAMVCSVTACGNAGTNGGTQKVKLDPKNPTTITIWNYYNADQLSAFEDLVSEFNDTVGEEEGIVAVSVSQGSIENLADSLMDAVNGKVGAQDIPTMAAVYSETGYKLQQEGMLVNLDDYFTEEELSAYVSGFVQEGRMIEDGELLLFPVSKSTECFAVNKTDWKAFEDATGVTLESVNSLEKLTEAAQKYYEWTDSLTPDVPEDGKALYGRDSIANYIFISAKELGHEMFKVTDQGVDVDLDRDTFKKIWDNYYIPFINGYFAAEANYRSEDMKTGKVLAMTGSTSSVNYLPTAVTDTNDEIHEIDMEVKEQLLFENASSPAYVQQGAEYCVLKTTAEEQYAATEFLKWFTQAERNIEFSVYSGYSPVTVEGNNPDKIKEKFENQEESAKTENIENALLVSSEIFSEKETYTCKPFKGSKEVRDALEQALSSVTRNDRQAVVEAIAAGQTREEAVAQYSTEEYFEQWFNQLTETVNKLIQ